LVIECQFQHNIIVYYTYCDILILYNIGTVTLFKVNILKGNHSKSSFKNKIIKITNFKCKIPYGSHFTLNDNILFYNSYIFLCKYLPTFYISGLTIEKTILFPWIMYAIITHSVWTNLWQFNINVYASNVISYQILNNYNYN